MSKRNYGGLSGRSTAPADEIPDAPLIVAIHGGTYGSAYFDVPGHSLLERASVNGVTAIAIDRPGYGDSPMLEGSGMTIAGQAAFLTQALGDIWRQDGSGKSGLVLVGHSIGAAIAATIASAPGDLPLIGLAISGVGLRTPGEHSAAWNAMPDIPTVDMPVPLKDQLMFGPQGSFAASMPEASHAANTPCPRPELIDIVGVWQQDMHHVLPRITVPVHYRQGEFDGLWVTGEDQIDGFAALLSGSSRVDAAMMRGAGHCIDFHLAGPALQLGQIGFALECGSNHAATGRG